MSVWELLAVLTAVWILGFAYGVHRAVKNAMPDPDDLRTQSPRVVDWQRREWLT